jgi:hypothetical protein
MRALRERRTDITRFGLDPNAVTGGVAALAVAVALLAHVLGLALAAALLVGSAVYITLVFLAEAAHIDDRVDRARARRLH